MKMDVMPMWNACGFKGQMVEMERRRSRVYDGELRFRLELKGAASFEVGKARHPGTRFHIPESHVGYEPFETGDSTEGVFPEALFESESLSLV